MKGLPEPYATYLDQVLQVWAMHLSRNACRVRYYDAKNSLKDLGISIPPPLAHNADFQSAVGWPAKAVQALAVRSRYDGFVNTDNTALDDILDVNGFSSKYRMAVVSELIGACAFVSVTRGRYMPVSIAVHSNMNAAAVWDYEKNRIAYGITVVSVDNHNRPTAYNLFTDDAVVYIYRLTDKETSWQFEIMPHPMGRPLIEPLVFQPALDRPFGSSRITRAVMSITDEAVREACRTSVAAEFATAPQRYIMGADPDMFDGVPEWQAYIGSILAISRDENDDMPQAGQFPQVNMQPHTDYMRLLASRFAGETSIPISALGIVQDNPSSAEAIQMANEDLVIAATNLNESNGYALKNIAHMALAIAGNKPLSELTPDELAVEPKFLSPAYPSILSQGDQVLKLITAIPALADSDVILEELGFDKTQISRIRSDQRKSLSSDVANSLNLATGGVI